jgi:hypothetical protein
VTNLSFFISILLKEFSALTHFILQTRIGAQVDANGDITSMVNYRRRIPNIPGEVYEQSEE